MVGFMVVEKGTELETGMSYRTEDNKPVFEFRKYLGCKSLDNIPELHVFLVEVDGIVVMDDKNEDIGYASEVYIIQELKNSEIMVQLWTNQMGVKIIYNEDNRALKGEVKII